MIRQRFATDDESKCVRSYFQRENIFELFNSYGIQEGVS